MELTNKQLQKLECGREYRSMTMAVRVLEDGNSGMIVEGYATTFNQPYILYEDRDFKLVEQISPTAFNDCDMTDVIFQYDHEGRVFARNKNKTLKLEIDSIGLKVTADLSGTDIGRSLYQEIKGGYTDKMSFGFVVAEDTMEYTDNHETGCTKCVRAIMKISKLYDVSAVSIPANDMTSISARKLSDGVIRELKAERLIRISTVKKIKLMMEV